MKISVYKIAVKVRFKFAIRSQDGRDAALTPTVGFVVNRMVDQSMLADRLLNQPLLYAMIVKPLAEYENLNAYYVRACHETPTKWCLRSRLQHGR